MALEFSYLSAKTGAAPTFSLHDRDQPLFEAAFSGLQARTGVFIDPYGTMRLYPDHQKLLVEFLRDSSHPFVRAFVAYLNEASTRDEVLLADGD